MGKLISIGELLIDFIPQKKGLKLSMVEGFTRVAGGAPANVAVCVSQLGEKSTLLTKVGNDAFGEYLIQTVQNKGVDTPQIKKTDDAKTALAFVSLSNDGERDFSFYRNPSADMLLLAEEVSESIFHNGDILHFCSVNLVDWPVKEAHVQAINYAKRNNMIISFDPNLRFPLWPDKVKYKKVINEFIPHAHIVKISDDELSFITGIEKKDNAVKSLFVGKFQ